MFCRRDAAARTGYTNPGEAARDEQTRGTVGGTLGGAALGAIIGAGAGNAGLGAARPARGAGLIAWHRHRFQQRPPGGARCAGRLFLRLLCLHARRWGPRSASGYGRGGYGGYGGYGDGYYDADYPPPPPPPGYYGYPAPYYPLLLRPGLLRPVGLVRLRLWRRPRLAWRAAALSTAADITAKAIRPVRHSRTI